MKAMEIRLSLPSDQWASGWPPGPPRSSARSRWLALQECIRLAILARELLLLPHGLPPEQVVARIGLFSDIHMAQRCTALPPSVPAVLRDADVIVHAGDVGELWVMDRLSAIAPVIAVHGNDDT
jgi:hypothetical protein